MRAKSTFKAGSGGGGGVVKRTWIKIEEWSILFENMIILTTFSEDKDISFYKGRHDH